MKNLDKELDVLLDKMNPLQGLDPRGDIKSFIRQREKELLKELEDDVIGEDEDNEIPEGAGIAIDNKGPVVIHVRNRLKESQRARKKELFK